MKNRVVFRGMLCVVCVIAAVAVSGCARLRVPPSLPDVKAEVARYMEGPAYERDIRRALVPAWEVLAALPTDGSVSAVKAAVVLDIDETSLSNFEYEKAVDFGHYGPAYYEWIGMQRAPAVAPVLEFYREAIRRGVAVFFVTGRRERFRAATEANLRAASYEVWERLYMKADDYREPSVVPYKSACRREIESGGYVVIVNIGDQFSDLEGGCAQRTVKLPNPIYRVK